ncbi:myotubularin-like protein [Achlya hypogyna]|uniref:Myotubularin-like protein n=1 Tax=Achlya hypogyna TaxID=1202772 RepID=A0A1V9ZGV0_ACHHY|nr:myotubularin-like protein [Achlya hypogyna]
MREIVTLQFGSASNRVGEALWTAALSEASAAGGDVESDVSLLRRAGRVVPRAVAFGCKGELKSVAPKTKNQEVSAWDGGIKTIAQDEEDDVKGSVLHPRSLVTVEEFRSFDPMNNYYDGLLSGDGKLRRESLEAAHDHVRRALEECDSIQGVQCFVDLDSTWGGMATEVLRELREECPSVFVICAGLDEKYPLVPQVGLFDQSKADGRRAINMASSILHLHELSSVFVPLAVSGDATGSFAPLSPSSADGSTLVAAAWDCLSGPYRFPRTTNVQMGNIVFPMRPSMKAMELACLFSPPTDYFERSGDDRLRLLEEASLLPVGPRDPSWSRARAHHLQLLTLRGDDSAFRGLQTPTWQAKASFDFYHVTTLAAPVVLPQAPIFENASREACLSALLITDAVPKYFSSLAHAVQTIDRRVVHEYVQAGMGFDALRELHSDMLTLSDSSL